MLYRDHPGNRGNLKSGTVQWMTAGRVIIHSDARAGRPQYGPLVMNTRDEIEQALADYRNGQLT